MKKLVFVFALLLQGCAWFNQTYPSHIPLIFGKGYFFMPEKTTLTFFWEWGEIVLQGFSLFTQKNDDAEKIVQESIKKRSDYVVCEEDVGGVLLGERVYQPSDFPNLNVECLYQMRLKLRLDFDALDDFFRTAFDRLCFVRIIDDKVHFYYEGDSLLADNSPDVVHRKLKIDESEKIKQLFIEKYPFYQEKTFHYEFVFRDDVPFFSISVQTDPEKLKGYKPLRLDSSILPLESPGYKKLLEEEKKRMK